MRYFFYAIVILGATFFFGWIGFAVAFFLAIGADLFSGKRIDIDHSEPFFSKTNTASIADVHFFELFGYLCKIDGVVSRDEIRGVEVIFDDLWFSAEDRAAAIAAFNDGKQADFDFDGTLAEVSKLELQPQTAAQLIHLMNVVVASADGSGLIEKERVLLFRIGRAFGLSIRQIAEILMVPQQQYWDQQAAQDETHQGEYDDESNRSTHWHQERAADSKSTLQMAYDTLGLGEDASSKTMIRRYKKLRSQYHPDKLSPAASEKKRTAAARRFTEIQRAWDIVRVRHGI